MKLPATLSKLVLILLLLHCTLAAPLIAQDGDKPVMENAFFNVVWGSVVGATVGLAVAVISSDDKSSPDNVRDATFTGATLGGLIGLGVGLFLVYQGITFDRAASNFSAIDPSPPDAAFAAAIVDPPFTLVSSRSDPLKITGFMARVLDLRF